MVSLSELTRPAGRPEPWRDAATGWRRLAADLQAVADDLDPRVSALRAPAWTGEAADAFTDLWHDKLEPELRGDVLAHYRGVAEQLDRTAEKIEEYNQLAQAAQLAVVAGVAFSVVTAGIGTAMGAGEAAVTVAEATVAYSALNAFLGLLEQALVRYATYWASTFVFSLAANGVAITVFDPSHNPLDADNWSIRGVAEAANSATIVAGMGAPTALEPLAEFATAHSLGWDLGTGFISGAAPSVYNLLLLEHARLAGDPRGTAYDAWWKILLFGGTWSGFNAGVGKAFAAREAGHARPLSPDDAADWLSTESGLLAPRVPTGYELTDSGLLVPEPPGLFERQPALIQSAALGFLPSTILRGLVPFPKQSAPASLPPLPAAVSPEPGSPTTTRRQPPAAPAWTYPPITR
jgi:uncharacterized protein YukE